MLPQMYKNLLFELSPTLLEQRFYKTDLGQLRLGIPIERLAELVPAPAYEQSGLGRKPWLDVKGGIGLLCLKHFLQISDEKLIERLNTDWAMQMFCGIQIKPTEPIKDTDLPSHWRGYIGMYLDIAKWQVVLASRWKPHLSQTQSSLHDATCYESRIAHPTDVKLLWQACSEVHHLIQALRKQYRERKSRNNYDERKREYLSYQKSRKKTFKQGKKLRKKLLKYLHRLIQLLSGLCVQHRITLSGKKKNRILTIEKLYEQQTRKLFGEEIEGRIVSINKPYIRPIIRGKETKGVEFGAKVNKLQVDGISFIEHLSYDAFNEGTRLEKGIRLHHELLGKCQQVSADAIYATNANRRYCKRKGIITNFVPKGRQKAAHIKQGEQMRAILNKERSTKLEGSFGNEKNHYLLNKVRARTQNTETCWIFFGIHTANAFAIGKRIAGKLKVTAQPPPQRVLPLAA
jgi:hypothetical protein